MILAGTTKKVEVKEELHQLIVTIHVHTTNKGQKPNNPFIFTINEYQNIPNINYILQDSCYSQVLAFFFKDQLVKPFQKPIDFVLEKLEKSNIVGKPCPYCFKDLQGFRFEGGDFAYISYYCPIHGFQGNEWDHFDS